MNKTTLQPDIHLVKIDQTQFFDEEYLKPYGRIWAIYIFDRNLHVNCCEVTPSYEMTFYKHEAELLGYEELEEEQIEELENKLREVDYEAQETEYYHVSYIEGMTQAKEDDLQAKPDNGSIVIKVLDIEGDTTSEAIEELIEYMNGNYSL